MDEKAEPRYQWSPLFGRAEDSDDRGQRRIDAIQVGRPPPLLTPPSALTDATTLDNVDSSTT